MLAWAIILSLYNWTWFFLTLIVSIGISVYTFMQLSDLEMINGLENGVEVTRKDTFSNHPVAFIVMFISTIGAAIMSGFIHAIIHLMMLGSAVGLAAGSAMNNADNSNLANSFTDLVS